MPRRTPDTTDRVGRLTATTADDESADVDRDEPATGLEAPFYQVTPVGRFAEQFGFDCVDCRSLAAPVDEMEQIWCPDRGTRHADDEAG